MTGIKGQGSAIGRRDGEAKAIGIEVPSKPLKENGGPRIGTGLPP